jgi:choloylglycine hydrolase
MYRTGAAGPDSKTWESQHSSIITANFGCATSDGINEKGLTANLLWFSAAKYTSDEEDTSGKLLSDKLLLSVSTWAQYILDSCATVEEAINQMRYVRVLMAEMTNANGITMDAMCHLVVGDVNGKSAIFEYINGILHISSNFDHSNPPENFKFYSDAETNVVTNDPVFSKQVKTTGYWDVLNEDLVKQGSQVMLPGSSFATDRFVRASHYSKSLSKTVENTKEAIAGLTSIMHNAAKPIENKEGNATWYTNLYDQKRCSYYHQSAHSPFMFCLNLKKIDFSDIAPDEGYTLTLEDGGELYDQASKEFFAGYVSSEQMSPEHEFTFAPAKNIYE